MASIILKNVSKTFKDCEIIKNISLHIEDGECAVLVGPSGCGKSTVLRLVCGLEEASEGDIFIGNRCVNDVPPASRGLAMVFQSYALYPHMTVFENMAFALKVRKLTKSEINRRVLYAANILKIDHLLDRKPKELSGGQRQRVAIGRAIVRKPYAFLFDEPLSNLDAGLRHKMRYELAKLKAQLKTTMIYVTHDQSEAMTLADKIVVMKDGIIEQVGSPIELYNAPANIFVGKFIGSHEMNLIDLTFVGEKDGMLEFASKAGDRILSTNRTSNVSPHKFRKKEEYVIGVRPEHITICNTNDCNKSDRNKDEELCAPYCNVIVGTLCMSENLGGESVSHIALEDGSQINAVSSVSVFPSSGSVEICIPCDKIYLFSKSGEAITGI